MQTHVTAEQFRYGPTLPQGWAYLAYEEAKVWVYGWNYRDDGGEPLFDVHVDDGRVVTVGPDTLIFFE